jgi:hypothetical protein
LASVVGALLSGDQVLLYQAVDQANCAVVGNMQLFCQLADRDGFAIQKAFNGE